MATTTRRTTDQRMRRRPTKQGTVLSEALIIDTALRLVREHGEGGLTVRRLGAALGADPSALYRYFRSTDELLLAIGDELIGRCMAGHRPSGDWLADLRDIGRRIHTTYRDHPRVAQLLAFRVTARTHEIAAVETLLGVLRGAGFGDADAVRYYHAFVDQALAFAALDTAMLGLPEGVRDARAWSETYAALPAAERPHIAATAGHLVAEMRESGYALALELLLESLASRLRGPAPR
ncbi:TetR/AcrR family transcriptional regulator [Phaeacidiphilus oryzae]|jgi:AcrR family transcriptional regulator|uniref:TetR/AcrR family transcriptional regulator n=1 Tax=Phaeacidiphilus oryzae TaxID=348818 RepID=UPI00056CC8B7|nr:TetR/AcrR family transcriptional regulator [Phaeacidiphilus oryzae]